MSTLDWDVAPFTAKYGDHLVIPTLIPYAKDSAGRLHPERVAIKAVKSDLEFTDGESGLSVVDYSGLLKAGFSASVGVYLDVSAKFTCALWKNTHTVTVDNKGLYVGDGGESYIKSVTWGIGARVAVVSWSLDVGASVEAGEIAMQTTLGTARSTYSAQVCGAGVDLLNAMTPLARAATGPFDMGALSTLVTVQERLNALVKQRKGLSPAPEAEEARKIRPTVLAVEVDTKLLGVATDGDLLRSVGTMIFAGERIYRDKSANEAAKDPGGFIAYTQTDLVPSMYRDIYGISDPAQKPSEADKERAKKILFAGRG